MARKAVQGYSEKSYYENKKFTGVIASSDPLQEGYFKHLVNLDPSDTGQSVKPRTGFLSTTVFVETPEHQQIVIASDVVKELAWIYDEAVEQPLIEARDYVYFPLENKIKRYTDYGGYSTKYSNVVEAVLPNPTEDYVYVDIEAMQLHIITTEERMVNSYKSPVSLSSDTVVYKDSALQEHILFDFKNDVGYRADISAYEIVDYLIPATHVISTYAWGDVVRYLAKVDDHIGSYYDTYDYDTTLIYIKQILHIVEDAEVIQAVDIDGIRRTLVRAYVEDGTDVERINFIITMKYREDAVTIPTPLTGDTLLFGVVDTYEHTTYDPTNRNIASPKSIIPSPMQNLYKDGGIINPRPAGHVSNLGLLYIREGADRYMINHVDRNTIYNIIPHFDLNPANIELDDANAKWAYRFDITSTKDFRYGGNALKEDVLYEGSWIDLDSGSFVFPTPTDTDLTNSTRADRHVKGTRYIISLVPKEVNLFNQDSHVTETGGQLPNGDKGTHPGAGKIAEFRQLYTDWKDVIDKVKSKSTLLEALDELSNIANIYIQDVHEDRTGGKLYATDLGFTTNNYVFGKEVNTIKDVAELSGLIHNEVIDRIGVSTDESFMNKTEIKELFNTEFFDESNFTFELFPIKAEDTLTIYEDATFTFVGDAGLVPLGTEDNTFYAHLDYFGAESEENMLTTYNIYENIVNHDISSDYDLDGENVKSISTDDIKNLAGMPSFEDDGFFDKGYTVTFYMRPYLDSEFNGKSFTQQQLLKTAWTTSSYTQTTSVGYGYDTLQLLNISVYQDTDPKYLASAKDYCVLDDSILVQWYNNMLYISETGKFNDYKELNKKEFAEDIIKVLPYKGILLVFTTEHLYAVHRVVEEKKVETSEGTVTESIIHWAKHKVLYNILTDRKYADTIQVFNDMVLFYSADGQLYLIRPNTMIDSETRFTLKLFNKSANDILMNYDIYINERLSNYNIQTQITKEDVIVKAMLSVNYIKINYSVPGYITYTLLYDVVNNRYLIYDTLTYTEIRDKFFVEGSECYLTVRDEKLYITMPYKEPFVSDNKVDMHVAANFKKIAINGFIDTGDLELNNHLKKRFRDLHIVFRNLSAHNILYNIETELDSKISHPYMQKERVEVQDVYGDTYFVDMDGSNHNELLELVDIADLSTVASEAYKYVLDKGMYENDMFMDFSKFEASKLITYKTSILGLGKVFRLKLQFISKGDYKIQNFGFIYKERRV